jgi:3',5'-cyclic AMP phosphodiesterase CpdA
MSTTLIQLSDTHFGTEQPAVMAALEDLVAAVRPAALLLTGDITQRARRAQFDAAQAWVRRLRVPAVLAVPGNHDIPLFNLAARCFWPYAGFRRAFGPELEPVFETADVLVLGLNTTRPWRHVEGALSEAQIERVAQRVARSPASQRRLVLVHQPLAVPEPAERHHVLHGASAARARWAAAGVDAVLGGHIHLPYALALSPGPRPLWALQAGTAISRRVRPTAGNSVNLIRTDAAAPAGFALERWDHDAQAGAFVRAAVQPLVPG